MNALYTVKDLKKEMKEQGLSPERLSKIVDISNMTIRRLLQKPAGTRLPSKYFQQLNRLIEPDQLLSNTSYKSFGDIIDHLEKSGKDADETRLKKDLSKKMKTGIPSNSFKSRLNFLNNILYQRKLTSKMRAIIKGALVYFINPLDYIPDNIPGFGYVDDFAVLTIALSYIVTMAKIPYIEK